jgi:type I restriction enzyme, S subunit
MNSKQFLSEFKHIIAASRSIEKIREMVLLFGVSGRLAENINAEESFVPFVSSEALLSLEKEPRKKQINWKEHYGGYSFHFPLSIPKNWTIAKLNKIAIINMGQSPDGTSITQVSGDGLPFYQGKTEFGVLHPIPRKWCKKPKKIAIRDDILLSVRAPVGPTNLCEEESCIGRGITAISVIKGIDKFYVLYVLRALEKYIAALGVGSTFTAISQKDIQGIPIPVPPVGEQKRIVAKINELIALCDKLEVQQQEREALCKLTRKAALDDLTTAQSSIALAVAWNRVQDNFNLWLNNREAITELRNTVGFLGCRGFLTESSLFYTTESNSATMPLPSEWSWKTLKQLSEYITSGSRGWKRFMAPLGDRFIRSQDIKYDSLVFEAPAFVVLPEQVEGMRTLIHPGDLLMTITGANVGKCAQAPQLNQKAYVSQRLCCMKAAKAKPSFIHP